MRKRRAFVQSTSGARINLIEREKRGPMNFRLHPAAADAGSQSCRLVCLRRRPPRARKKTCRQEGTPKPTVEDQIQALRQEFQGQIDGLKTDLANKDTQLRQAQQAAADAQAAAAKAQAAADAQQQTLTDNTTAVSTLQGTVGDLKANAVSLATTVSDETSAIKKSDRKPGYDSLQGHRSLLYRQLHRGRNCVAPGSDRRRHQHRFYGRSPAELRRRADQRVLRHGPPVASRIQGNRKAQRHNPDRLLRNGLAGRRHHFKQQPIKQLRSAPTPVVGGREDSGMAGMFRGAKDGHWSRKPHRV